MKGSPVFHLRFWTRISIKTDKNSVLNRWKFDYEHLYNDVSSNTFDADHLQRIKGNLQTPDAPDFPIADCSTLNEPISYEEIRKCVYEAKLRKASSFDNTLLYSFKRYVRSSEMDINLYNKATLTYKDLNGLTPEHITNMLTSNSQVHDRQLRSSVDGTLMVPRLRTSMYDRSFSVSAPKYWNSLPPYSKTAPSLS